MSTYTWVEMLEEGEAWLSMVRVAHTKLQHLISALPTSGSDSSLELIIPKSLAAELRMKGPILEYGISGEAGE